MGANSKIEWTDHTFNPWIGCSKVHEGCTHCYAEALSKRTGKAAWGPNGTRVKTSATYWQQPLKWNRDAAAAGERRRVFCASLADVFEDWQGPIHDHRGDRLGFSDGEFCTIVDPQTPYRATLNRLRRELFRLIEATPSLDWLLLTKRPENVLKMWRLPSNDEQLANYEESRSLDFRSNVWLGTSVSDQATAERMVPHLLRCRDLAPVLFLSAEPLLGTINLRALEAPPPCQHSMNGGLKYDALADNAARYYDPPGRIDWVIVGGESGPGARPMHPDWARLIRDDCQAAGVPFFFKQWGEWAPGDAEFRGGEPGSMWRVGKKAAGRLLDGREWNEFPQTEVAHA